MVPLEALNEGESGEIAMISQGGCRKGKHFRGPNCNNENCRMSDLGLRVGKKIKLLQKGRRGPLLVKVDESRIAIGKGMAERIQINKLQE